ncbi:MAG: hypothetical protein AAGC68_07305 [Verrucomicrobiota bacterium]
MKRSGNHAVINWITEQGRFIFLNNDINICPILEGVHSMPRPEPFPSWLKCQFQRGSLPFSQGNGEKFLVGRLFAHPLLNRDWVRKKLMRNYGLIASLEDHALGVRPFADEPVPTEHVLIVRDPSSLFSSRIRKASLVHGHPSYPTSPGPEMDRVVKLWKSHARELLDSTDHLENRIGIYFDAWFSSREYRKNLSRSLGLTFSDAGLQRVSGVGGGSSFDSTRFDRTTQEMDVLNRETYLSDQEREILAVMLRDEELRELSEELKSIEL